VIVAPEENEAIPKNRLKTVTILLSDRVITPPFLFVPRASKICDRRGQNNRPGSRATCAGA
jgi:hypothetical protein